MKKRVGLAVLLPVWVLVAFVLVQLLLAAVLRGLEAANVSFAGINSNVFSFVLSAILYLLVLAVTIGSPWLLFKRKTTRTEVGLHRLPAWKDLGIAPVGFIGYLLLTGVFTLIAQQYLPFIDYNQAQDTGFEGLTFRYEYILAFVTLVVVAPVAEEVLFRGYLFGKLRTVVPLWVSILITSALFGLVHLAWNVGIDVFALSIAMCLVRVWSGSLWPSIFIHMSKNFIAFYLLFINTTLLTTMGG